MDTSHLDGPDIAAADQPAAHGTVTIDDSTPTSAREKPVGPAMGRLLPGLWLTMAVGFVVLPFLTQYRDVSVTAVQLLDLYARLDLEVVSESGYWTDVTIGPVAWLILGLGVSAAVAVALSFARIRSLRRRNPQPSTPQRPSSTVRCSS
jgi:hypothetical protein